MIPIIVCGGNIQDRAVEITSRFPNLTYATTHIVAADKSITIAQIHDLIKSLGTTSPVPRLIWLEEASSITIPAQNALLKLLEEPPNNVQIVLTLDNPHALIATIRSRCQLVTITTSQTVEQADLSLIKQAMSLTAGDRIIAADSLGRKREVALAWTRSTLDTIEQKIKSEKSPKSVIVLSQIGALIHNAHVDLQANVAVSLVMQNLFLSLPRTKR